MHSRVARTSALVARVLRLIHHQSSNNIKNSIFLGNYILRPWVSNSEIKHFSKLEGVLLICALKEQKSPTGSTFSPCTTDVKNTNTPRNQTPDVKNDIFLNRFRGGYRGGGW